MKPLSTYLGMMDNFMPPEGEDPSKPKKLSPQELAFQNAQVKRFGMTHGMMDAQNLHVGEYGAPYVDENGNPVPEGVPQRYPEGTITSMNDIPVSIRGNVLRFDPNMRLNYYEDPQSGEQKFVSHEIAAASRFNPNRGTYDQKLIAKK